MKNNGPQSKVRKSSEYKGVINVTAAIVSSSNGPFWRDVFEFALINGIDL